MLLARNIGRGFDLDRSAPSGPWGGRRPPGRQRVRSGFLTLVRGLIQAGQAHRCLVSQPIFRRTIAPVLSSAAAAGRNAETQGEAGEPLSVERIGRLARGNQSRHRFGIMGEWFMVERRTTGGIHGYFDCGMLGDHAGEPMGQRTRAIIRDGSVSSVKPHWA